MTAKPKRKFNLTPLRLRALRMIQQRPGMLARDLADLCEEREAMWLKNGGTWNGFMRSGTGKQAMTRWGSAYAIPLINAGLVNKRWSEVGWAHLALTALGDQVARTGEMPQASST